MPYHVLVSIRGATQPEAELDLTEEAVRHRFVRPLKEGRPLVVGGRRVEATEIGGLEIYFSNEPSREIIERVQLEYQVREMPLHDRQKLERQAARRTEDVTRRMLGDSQIVDQRTVFLARGRWEEVARAMRDLLGAMDLRVVNWPEARLLGTEGQFNADILRNAMEQAYGVVVLLTPDDLAALHPDLSPEALSGQARPNVIFEAGYAWHAKQNRTLFVHYGETRRISNLSGVDRLLFDDSDRSRYELAERLKNMGMAVRTDGGQFLSSSRFPPLLRQVSADELGFAPPTDLLAGLPLNWVLLAAMEPGEPVDVNAVAAQTGRKIADVSHALSGLLKDKLAEPMPGHSPAQAAANGSCLLSPEGHSRLRAERERYKG